MLTNITSEELILTAQRLEAADLLAQADYTMLVATMDGLEPAGLLPQGFLSKVKETQKQVDKALAQRFRGGEERELRLKMGLLYQELWEITLAGQKLYAGDAQSAAAYNLELLQ
ncbi:hypothetical protein HZA73_03825 [candidate division TA06 bacterium]|nr:hypothetical protein [candidate division TA06 bacterium]